MRHLAFAVLALLPAAALAAEPPARTVEEIVVTAQKREEALKDTPISVAVFSPEQLENMGAQDLGDLTGFAPNVDITPFPNSRSSLVIFMRGVGNNDVQTSQDPAVGVYLDGVYLGRAVGLTTDIADLERIEVLRGPQGTLYGRNTTGGAINLISAGPSGAFGFRQSFGAGSRGHGQWRSQLDTPAWNGLAAKINYMGSRRDGFVENINEGPDFGEEDKQALRAAFSLDLGEDFGLDYAWDRSDARGPQQFYQVLSINEENATTSTATQNLLQNEFDNLVAGGMTPPDQLANSLAAIVIVNETLIPEFRARASESRLDKGEWDIPVEDTVTKVSGHSLIARWDLGSAEFKSTTALRDLSEDIVQDYGSGVQWFDVQIEIEQEQASQEFQLVGDIGSSLRFATGLYYFEEEGLEHEIDAIAGDVAEDRTIWTDNSTWAAYGQFTWTPSFLPPLDITLGGRYTVDKRDARKHSINFTNSPDNTLEGSERWSNFNPSLILDYAWGESLNTYAKAVTGYKSGGFNVRSTEEGFLPPFNEEQMISYELGFKSLLFEDTVRLNVAAYYSDYEDMQIQQILDNSKIFLTDVFNAGAARVAGFEVEATAVLLDGLTLGLNYGYTDAKFTEVIDNNPESQTYEQDISDTYTMPYAPENTWSVTLDYQFPDFGLGQLDAFVSYRWRDERFGTASNPDMEGFFLDNYGLLDARISLGGLKLWGSDLAFSLWGQNLTDEEYLVHNISMGFFRSGYFGEPRVAGIDMSLNF